MTIANFNSSQDDIYLETRRLAASLSRRAMATLGHLLTDDANVPPDLQRRAAIDILRFTIGSPNVAGRASVSADPNRGN